MDVCFKCGKLGYIARYCKVRDQILILELEEDVKTQILNIIDHISESKAKQDEIFHIQENSDEEYEFLANNCECIGIWECRYSSSDKQFFLELKLN